MNMLDTKKTTRGVTLWREDILKYKSKDHGNCSLSEFLRDLLHKRMEKYDLTEADRVELDRQVAEADKIRQTRLKGAESKKPSRLARRLSFSEAIAIPAKVRKGAKFVKGK